MMEKKAEEKADTMALWDAVCKSDPQFLKQVERSKRGPFTSICAQSQRKAATERWGPYGKTWGVQSLEWGVCPVTQELTLSAEFWYPGGNFPIATELPAKVGGENRKKLLTDLTTKALSMLGFNADVFLGTFDGSRYENGSEGPKKSSDPTPTECPKCGKKGTIIKGKEEYGGGWVCWKKSKKEGGGCGHSWGKEDSAGTPGNARESEGPDPALEKQIWNAQNRRIRAMKPEGMTADQWDEHIHAMAAGMYPEAIDVGCKISLKDLTGKQMNGLGDLINSEQNS